MNKRKFTVGLLTSIGMLMLILDGKSAITGASDAIDLCLTALIPSLFPFFMLSNLLIGSLYGQTLPFLRPLTRLCKIPDGVESLFLIGLLGGYPVGAQNIATSYRHGHLNHTNAVRMLAFCNNAGPAFIFGILSAVFTQKSTCFLLWAVHIASAFFVGISLPGESPNEQTSPQSTEISVTDALSHSIKAMSLVCGWVIIMRIILTFMQRWFLWLFPIPMQVIISGFLELSNGCIYLTEVPSEGLRFMIASAMLAIGGVCVTLQTASVASSLSLASYIPGKILQCCFSIMLSCLLQFVFPTQLRFQNTSVVLASSGIILLIFLARNHRSWKKSSSIPTIIGV